MVDGCFDPLHPGHVAYFREARKLGLPVLCNLAGDAYLSRKHPPLLREQERVLILDALRDLDYTHLNCGRSTAEVLQELRPRFYVKGSDWRGRLPEAEVVVCRELGIEIAYVEHTGHASRHILADYLSRAGGGPIDPETAG